ncbi:Dyslexia-associated protein KIAA0319-like protein [Geodia barretti]|uniref:Dyslexia-associated protein KIAA0319-like protein n=1 Tax=Geodia barretti TaxID=519541 RepID=A0AA35SLW6_GEOBA|nr:Dyslexia-associated protein KIAA0319-like protein [Geodia barretti]
MADRPRAARAVLLYLLVLCLSLFHVASGFAHPGQRGGPYPPTLPSPRHRTNFPASSNQFRYHQQQQQHDGVNTNNVNPYYDDGYREEDSEAESDDPFSSPQEQDYAAQNLYGDSLPSNPHRNEQGFAPTMPTWQSRVQSPPDGGTPESECSISEKYKNSVPRGRPGEITITRLESNTAAGCMRKCCALGPRDCTFVWVYGGKCMAVSCPPESPELCKPEELDEHDAARMGQTGYYKIIHPLEHNIKSEFENDATVSTPSTDDVMITSPNDGDSPIEGDNDDVMPTEASATTHQSVFAGDQPSQFNWHQSDHETTKTDHEETTTDQSKTIADHEDTTMEATGREGTTTDHGETKVGYSETTTDHSETTLDQTLDNQAGKTQNQDSTDTTKPPLSLSTPHEQDLTIVVSGETDVVLPVNRVQLFASSWPDPPSLDYHWSRVFGPKEGELSGMNDAAVTLSELVPGVYGLRVTATAPSGQFGAEFVNVTVHEEPRENTPPQLVISPSTNYTITLPQSTVIFDASQSRDDKGLENLSFHWQLVAGPIGTTGESNEALLTLNNPQPGQYTYKLTVTDSDGATNGSLVGLKVVPEPDYPPHANAGSDVILKLPNSEVVLNGTRTSDDKPGLKYLWKMLSEQSGIDMEGTDTPYLRVSKLTVGVYLFKLTVTDSAGHTDEGKVTVDVLPEKNDPPEANAGGPYTVRYPETEKILDGSRSTDDYGKGMKYSWTQTSGPRDVILKGTNTSRLVVSKLHIDPAQGSPTIFTFNLTITDYGNLTSTATAHLEYRKDPKILPHVSAGPDLTVALPQNTAILNGSATWDDFGITSYQWSRSDHSPAAGIPLLDSDSKPVLILSDLVNGTYNFTLRVTNGQGVSASDAMVLHVLANPHDRHIIQLHLDADISNFTRADLKDLGKYLSLTLDDYTIQFQGVYESHPHTVVEFYAVDTRTDTFMNVSDAWRKLTENGQDYRVLRYHIVHVDMKECQLSCSDHGTCDKRSRRCHCDTFWMENPFTANTGRQESNCGEPLTGHGFRTRFSGQDQTVFQDMFIAACNFQFVHAHDALLAHITSRLL